MAQQAQERRIDQFFSGPGARADEWRGLVEAAKAWSSGVGRSHRLRGKTFPACDHRRISCLSRSAADGGSDRSARPQVTRQARLRSRCASRSRCRRARSASMPAIGMRMRMPTTGNAGSAAAGIWRDHARRPYFETLIVTGIPATNWPTLAAEWRKLRRPVDAFIYEPVFAGSFEDAFCAAMLNPDLAAVIVNEGFAQHSRHDAPVLRSLMASMDQKETSELSVGAGAHAEAHPARARRLSGLEPRRGGAGRQSRGQCRSPHLLLGRRAARTASRHPRGRSGPLRNAVLRQSQEIRAAPDRDLPRAADRPRQVRLQVGLDPRHGRVLRAEPLPRREQRHHRAVSTACSSRPATSRTRRKRRRAPSAPTRSSLSPTAPRRRTRWRCRR